MEEARIVIADIDDTMKGPIMVSKLTLEPRSSADGLDDWVRITSM